MLQHRSEREAEGLEVHAQGKLTKRGPLLYVLFETLVKGLATYHGRRIAGVAAEGSGRMAGLVVPSPNTCT